MKPFVLIEHEQIDMPVDAFYEEARRSIDSAQLLWCARGLNCDWLGDPMAFGICIFPLAIYRKMEELKHAGNPSS